MPAPHINTLNTPPYRRLIRRRRFITYVEHAPSSGYSGSSYILNAPPQLANPAHDKSQTLGLHSLTGCIAALEKLEAQKTRLLCRFSVKPRSGPREWKVGSQDLREMQRRGRAKDLKFGLLISGLGFRVQGLGFKEFKVFDLVEGVQEGLRGSPSLRRTALNHSTLNRSTTLNPKP